MSTCPLCNGRGTYSEIARFDDPDAHIFVGSFGLEFRYKSVRCVPCVGSGDANEPSRWEEDIEQEEDDNG